MVVVGKDDGGTENQWNLEEDVVQYVWNIARLEKRLINYQW